MSAASNEPSPLGAVLPEPVRTELSDPFWRAAADGVLQVQSCRACGHLRYPISDRCPRCIERSTEWVPMSGFGSIHAVVKYHRAFHPALAALVPYTVAIVELDEGPRMLSNIVGDRAQDARVGDRVHVWFDRIGPDLAVPRFVVTQEVIEHGPTA